VILSHEGNGFYRLLSAVEQVEFDRGHSGDLERRILYQQSFSATVHYTAFDFID
jgi:hypothetical protein